MDTKELISTLTGVSSIIVHTNKLRAHLESKLSPHFSIFEPIGFYSERTISAVIGLLLDPHGSHGQGDSFLRAYLEMLACNFIYNQPVQKLLKCDLSSAYVVCEQCTCERRFIDIYIKIGDKSFGIENKLWAVDQDKQVNDYLDYVTEFIVYLSVEKEPSEESISSIRREKEEHDGRLMITHYQPHMVAWLNKCLTIVQSEKVRWFIQEIINLINTKYYEENTFMSDFILEDVILKDRNVFEAFIALREQERAMQDALVGNFITGIKDEITRRLEHYNDWKVAYDGVTRNRRTEFLRIEKKNIKDTYIIIDFDEYDYKRIYYGIHNVAHIELFCGIIGGSKFNDDWGAWKYIDELPSCTNSDGLIKLYDYYKESKNSVLTTVISMALDNIEKILKQFDKVK